MAGELVETSRLWARQNAAIKPEWAERLGAHLVKRTYSEPHWSQQAGRGDGPRAGHAVRRPAGRRPARHLRQDRPARWPASCSSGTRSCTASGRPGTGSTRENLRLLEEAEELEHRARRRDIVVDEHTLFDFYDARVGAEVRQRRALRPVVEAGAAASSPTCSPSTRRCSPTTPPRRCARRTTPRRGSSGEGLTFPISYHFEPGAADDGLTIDVPVATLNRVDGRRLLLERARACARSWSPA